MPNLTLMLPEEMLEALRKASKAEDRTISLLIRKAIAKYLQEVHGTDVEYAVKWGRPSSSNEGEKDGGQDE